MGAYIYVIFITFLFFGMGILWFTLDYATDLGYGNFTSMISASSNDTIASGANTTRSIMNSIWKYFPIPVILFGMIWMIVLAQRKEEEF